MKAHSENFDEICLADEELEGIILNYTTGYEAWIVSSIRYYKVKKLLEQNNMMDQFNITIQEIETMHIDEVNNIGIQFESGYYVGKRWIKRAIKKQLFFYLNEKKIPEFNRYRLANPLADNQIQQEIVDRAIGWEYWYNIKNEHPVKWEEDKTIQEILSGEEYKSSFKFPEDYWLREGQISSWALALLGKRLRELALDE